jgi:glycosyltransferase involved in cell wall biosynthesis
LSLIGYLAEPLYLRLLPRSAPVITISESTKRDLQRHGFQPGRIHIIPEGIELPPVRAVAAATKSPHPTLLSLGSIRPMKRTLDAVKAFELARDRRPDLRLVVAGDATGPYGRRVLHYVAASRHTTAITYAGRPSAAQKLQLMRRAHTLLATSVKEGWGLTVTEAASQATPAVVYDADGLRDSVRDGVTGLIDHTRTPAGLATKIIELLEDPARYASLQRAAWSMSKRITFAESYRQFKDVLAETLVPSKTTAPKKSRQYSFSEQIPRKNRS